MDEHVRKCYNVKYYVAEIPVYDSPCLLTERAAVDIVPSEKGERGR